MTYYAVKAGRIPGIYENWADCKEQIHGYSGAIFKGFNDRAAADLFLTEQEPTPINKELPFAYIDGTYNQSSGIYGYGGYICAAGKYYIIQGTGNNPEYVSERNIAGETIGILQVVFKALQLGIEELNIYFDYAGLENWINGSWQAKSPLSKYYCETMAILDSSIKVNFIKVKGHSGNEGNEIADYLAKEAAGAKLRKKDIAALADFRAAAGIA